MSNMDGSPLSWTPEDELNQKTIASLLKENSELKAELEAFEEVAKAAGALMQNQLNDIATLKSAPTAREIYLIGLLKQTSKAIEAAYCYLKQNGVPEHSNEMVTLNFAYIELKRAFESQGEVNNGRV